MSERNAVVCKERATDPSGRLFAHRGLTDHVRVTDRRPAGRLAEHLLRREAPREPIRVPVVYHGGASPCGRARSVFGAFLIARVIARGLVECRSTGRELLVRKRRATLSATSKLGVAKRFGGTVGERQCGPASPLARSDGLIRRRISTKHYPEVDRPGTGLKRCGNAQIVRQRF